MSQKNVFQDLELIFQGKAINPDSNIVDFGSINPGKVSRPECKRTVCYIVCGVFFNEAGEVLMIQEAKESCRGKWYLPAGRVEPGENFLEAVKREVLEETGLECEPTSLVLIENAMNYWYRFTFTGHITGGHLKTPEEADEESIEARWCSDIMDMDLRGFDIISMIDVVSKHHQSSSEARHPDLLPAIFPHNQLYMRLVFVIRQRISVSSDASESTSAHPTPKDNHLINVSSEASDSTLAHPSLKCNVTPKDNHLINDRVQVLISTRQKPHLPLAEIGSQESLFGIFRDTVTIIFGDIPIQKFHGALCLEHCGFPVYEHDGFCLTILISVKLASEDVTPIVPCFEWLELPQELEDIVMTRLNNNMTIPIKVLH